ncbi:MAG: amidohydrolase family protein [Planctomycetes bacterium]|nr:amidohydrolase family protein [Planctomycetota bacterium]
MPDLHASGEKPLVDAHCHIGPCPSGNLKIDRLIKEMGQNAVSLALVSPARADDAIAIANANNTIRKAVNRFPDRIVGLGAVRPQETAEACEEAERARDKGLHGLKVRPIPGDFHLTRNQLVPIAEKALELGQFLYIQSGSRLSPILKETAALARKFPELHIIFSFRKSPPVETFPPDEQLEPENLLFDTSSLKSENLTMLFHKIGKRRLVFGSGFPFGSQRVELSKAYRAISSEAVPFVYSQNICSVLCDCGINIPA